MSRENRPKIDLFFLFFKILFSYSILYPGDDIERFQVRAHLLPDENLFFPLISFFCPFFLFSSLGYSESSSFMIIFCTSSDFKNVFDLL